MMTIVDIAGICFALRTPKESLIGIAEKAYQPFQQSNPQTCNLKIPVSFEMDSPPRMIGSSPIFEDRGSWTIFASDEGFVMSSIAVESDKPIWSVRFDRGVSEAKIYADNFTVSINNLFSYPLDQVLFIHALSSRNGALIHSAAIDYKGKSFMFAGKSGAGKSTLSRNFQSAGYEVLSDDRIAVRKMDKDFFAFGTPWSGDANIALNKGLPLGGIFFISHSANNVIRKATPAEAAERLMPVTSIPFYDKETTLRILAFCEDLVLHIPAYELSFKPGSEVVDLVEEYVSRQ